MVFDFQQDKAKIRTSSQHAGINLSSSSYTEIIDFFASALNFPGIN